MRKQSVRFYLVNFVFSLMVVSVINAQRVMTTAHANIPVELPVSPTDVNIGKCYDYESNSLPGDRAIPITYRSEKSDSIGRIGVQSYFEDFISSEDDLEQNLDVNVNIEYKNLLAGASNNFSFADDHQNHHKFIYFAIYIARDYYTEDINQIKYEHQLLDEASLLIDPKGFADKYGKEYVSSITYGVRLCLLYKLELDENDDERAVKDGFKAMYTGSIGSISGSADFSSFYNAMKSTCKISVVAKNIIGGTVFPNTDFTNLANVYAFIQSWNKSADIRSAQPVKFTTQYYPGLPDSYKYSDLDVALIKRASQCMEQIRDCESLLKILVGRNNADEEKQFGYTKQQNDMGKLESAVLNASNDYLQSLNPQGKGTYRALSDLIDDIINHQRCVVTYKIDSPCLDGDASISVFKNDGRPNPTGKIELRGLPMTNTDNNIITCDCSYDVEGIGHGSMGASGLDAADGEQAHDYYWQLTAYVDGNPCAGESSDHYNNANHWNETYNSIMHHKISWTFNFTRPIDGRATLQFQNEGCQPFGTLRNFNIHCTVRQPK